MGNNSSSLHGLAKSNDISGVRIFVQDHPSKIDEPDKEYARTALQTASSCGHDAIVQELLARKANVNAADKDGSTALHLAAANGCARVVKLLLQYGADPLAEDTEGRTPLQVALQQGREAAAGVLSVHTPSMQPQALLNTGLVGVAGTYAPLQQAASNQVPGGVYPSAPTLPPHQDVMHQRYHELQLGQATASDLQVDLSDGYLAYITPESSHQQLSAVPEPEDTSHPQLSAVPEPKDTSHPQLSAVPEPEDTCRPPQQLQAYQSSAQDPSTNTSQHTDGGGDAAAGKHAATTAQEGAEDGGWGTASKTSGWGGEDTDDDSEEGDHGWGAAGGGDWGDGGGGTTEHSSGRMKQQQEQEQVMLQLPLFGYNELCRATDDFSPHLDLGGGVYRGVLNGAEVLVARAPIDQALGDQQLQTAVQSWLQLQHPNILPCLGYCAGPSPCLLWNTSMGRPLRDCLGPHGAWPLLWPQRISIAVDVAAALAYLHSQDPPVLLRSLSSAGVIVCHEGAAKVACSVWGQQTAFKSNPISLPDLTAIGGLMLELMSGSSGSEVEAAVAAVLQQDDTRLQTCIDPSAADWPLQDAVMFARLALDCSGPGPHMAASELLMRLQEMQDAASKWGTGLTPTLSVAPSAPPLPPGFNVPELSVSADEPPAMFICPITQDVMEDPVFATDGYTYERTAIEAWIQKHNTSPMTNLVLSSSVVVANLTLRSAIKEWLEVHTEHR